MKASAKVIADETDTKLVLSILPNISPGQRFALIAWAVLWAVLGIAVMFYFPSATGDERLLLIIYLAFWAYFLFTSARALFWNLAGGEHLSVENGELSYKRSWRGYGSVQTYDGDTMENLGVLNLDDRSFAKSYGEAFWSIGGERLGFEYIGRKVAFGMKLSNEDARKVAARLRQKLLATRAS